jgi:hypothetical protein
LAQTERRHCRRRPSRWANPHVVGDPGGEFCGTSRDAGAEFYDPQDQRGCELSLPLTAAEAVDLYRNHLTDWLADEDPFYDELRAAPGSHHGHDLASGARWPTHRVLAASPSGDLLAALPDHSSAKLRGHPLSLSVNTLAF